MSFSLPTFNLRCNIISGVGPAVPVIRLTSDCNLARGRRVSNLGGFQLDDTAWSSVVSLLLPALTDVRDNSISGNPDTIEVPLGSGRWYFVINVDDVGKGFPNEYRVALLSKLSPFVQGSSVPARYAWPVPIP